MALGGLTESSELFWPDCKVSYAHNSWFREARCVEQSLSEVGLDDFGVRECGHSSKRACFAISNQVTVSTGTYFPMGALCRVYGKQAWVW